MLGGRLGERLRHLSHVGATHFGSEDVSWVDLHVGSTLWQGHLVIILIRIISGRVQDVGCHNLHHILLEQVEWSRVLLLLLFIQLLNKLQQGQQVEVTLTLQAIGGQNLNDWLHVRAGTKEFPKARLGVALGHELLHELLALAVGRSPVRQVDPAAQRDASNLFCVARRAGSGSMDHTVLFSQRCLNLSVGWRRGRRLKGRCQLCSGHRVPHGRCMRQCHQEQRHEQGR
mmetsp:Transcript_64529/g.154125  ORF Transcript_64529/g.154125 Transcript_64529/m.154125 type:complete len:229 (+) Transcript_64529:1130-1816(+)